MPMGDNSSNTDPVDAILQSDRVSQQLREQEDAEIERQHRRADELHAAFAAVRHFTAVAFDTLGYQKGELTDQEFCDKWADLWLVLGDQLQDKPELLAQQPGDLCAEPGDAPRTIALAVLTAAVQRDKAKISGLFQQLTTASAELQAAANEWLRYRLEWLLMGNSIVREDDQPKGQDSGLGEQPEETAAASEPETTEPADIASSAKLSPSRQKAYGQFLWAVRENAALDGAIDREVYDWLIENWKEERLPPFAAWCRYLRDARAAEGTSKYTPRAGRQSGRSIVRPDDI
jgi:hypothetical protein